MEGRTAFRCCLPDGVGLVEGHVVPLQSADWRPGQAKYRIAVTATAHGVTISIGTIDELGGWLRAVNADVEASAAADPEGWSFVLCVLDWPGGANVVLDHLRYAFFEEPPYNLPLSANAPRVADGVLRFLVMGSSVPEFQRELWECHYDLAKGSFSMVLLPQRASQPSG